MSAEFQNSSKRVNASGETLDFPDREDPYDFLFKVVLIGDAGVGKTCVIQRFKHGVYFDRLGNTIGVDFMLKTVDAEGKKIKLQLWDTAGQERFRTITRSYYRGAHAAILAYDITRLQSFDNIPTWVNDVRRYAGPDTLLLLMGTKLDIATEHTELRRVTLSEAQAMVAAHRMMNVVETSAKKDTNIDAVFDHLAQALRKKHDGTIPTVTTRSSAVSLAQQEPLIRISKGVDCC